MTAAAADHQSGASLLTGGKTNVCVWGSVLMQGKV